MESEVDEELSEGISESAVMSPSQPRQSASVHEQAPPTRVLPTADELDSPAEALEALRSAIDVTADPIA